MPQLRVFLTECGFSFGDNNLVVDMLALVVFGEAFGEDAVFGDDPANANPDGANVLHWKNLRPRLESLLTIHGVVLAKIQDPKESESKER